MPLALKLGAAVRVAKEHEVVGRVAAHIVPRRDQRVRVPVDDPIGVVLVAACERPRQIEHHRVPSAVQNVQPPTHKHIHPPLLRRPSHLHYDWADSTDSSRLQPRCGCEKGVSPSRAADVKGTSPILVQMWAARAQSWYRCGQGEPSPGQI